MEKRNWKHSVTLKQRMVLCLAAFFAAFALQLALNGYQARAVQQVQDDQMGNFNAISRFQGGVESSISILEAYRWENGETEEMLEKLQAACSTSNAWLWRIRSNMDGLQNVSDEQWVLYGAVETTYGSYNTLLEELESYLSSGQEAKASQLYYNKVSVCGGYLSQYTMQLLKASILDAQTTYTEISELGERIALMQIVVVALCVALGCASGLMVMQLLTPVSQMIEASRAISRSQFDTPDIPLPKQPEIGQLAESFNRMKHSMAQQVSTLQEKNEIERELHRQKTEALELQNRMERSRLQPLRSQIDPHFLFNTLNVIQQLAGHIQLILVYLHGPAVKDAVRALIVIIQRHRAEYDLAALLKNAVCRALIFHHPPQRIADIPEQFPLVELVPGKIPQLIRDKGAADGLPACHALHRSGEFSRGKLFLPFKHPEAHHSHIRILFLQVTAKRFQHPAVQKVITVHKAEIRSLCPFEHRVARCRESPVFLVDCRYAFFLCGIFVADGSAGIGGTIVHQDDLGLLPGGEQGLDAVAHICRRVVARDGEGDQFLSHTKYSFALFRQMHKAGAGMEICAHIIAFLCRKCYRTWEMSEMFYNYPGSCGILIGL